MNSHSETNSYLGVQSVTIKIEIDIFLSFYTYDLQKTWHAVAKVLTKADALVIFVLLESQHSTEPSLSRFSGPYSKNDVLKPNNCINFVV